LAVRQKVRLCLAVFYWRRCCNLTSAQYPIALILRYVFVIIPFDLWFQIAHLIHKEKQLKSSVASIVQEAKIPEKKQEKGGLINTLIRLNSPRWVQILNPPAFLLLFYASSRSFSFAINIVGGMYIHELFHAFKFARMGIRWIIQGLWPLGAVARPENEEEDRKSDLAPWNDQAWLMQLGPTANVLLMFVGLLLTVFGTGWVSLFGATTISAQGLLAALNLIPLWKLDAGQLYTLIFSSLEERYDRLVAIVLTGVSIAIVAYLVFFSSLNAPLWIYLGKALENGALVVFLLVSIPSIWRKQSQDKPEDSKSTQAMTKKQVFIQIGYHIFLVTMMLVIFYISR
jgi:hypothetical protein